MIDIEVKYLKLEIRCEIPSLNKIISYAQRNKMRYGSVKKKIGKIIREQILQQRNGVQFNRDPITLSLMWRCKNKRTDPDNTSAGIKYLLDELQNAGIIENDGWNIKEINHKFIVDKVNIGVDMVITSAKI